LATAELAPTLAAPSAQPTTAQATSCLSCIAEPSSSVDARPERESREVL
jgi:hypothetical protein